MGEPADEKVHPVSESTCFSSSGSSETKEPQIKNQILSCDNEELCYDHGWKAWSQVLASFFLFFNTWGLVIAYGSFQTYYEQQLLVGDSPSTISWIGSIQAFLLLFVGAVTGPLFDAGYTRMLAMGGWFLYSFGLMTTSISTELWQIMLSQVFCIGLGCGMVFVSCVAVLPQYFKRRRDLANGIAALGTGIGGMVYPVMFRQVQLKLGFAWATREKRALVQLSAFKEPAFCLFCIAQFVGFVGLYNVLVYVQPYAIDNGVMSEKLAFYLVAILNASSTVGRILPNYVADFIGPLNIMIPMTLAIGILDFAWVGIHNAAGLIALVVLYGFTAAGFVAVAPIAVMNITTDMRDLARAWGCRLSFALRAH
ncbi:hypothetical protein PAAG_00811 [Paracoccidioides lutzii Pb01]|uniref:Major facilitator superfamily (MFS) profile domain-containing protein n=1 Tax=Paracoccidioides lutzii (strain ATCC MYA-826 / Pb01) TaxID=502779 RepID=C1GQL6_PARBA|nr:hypothetical protein PAAG_00811 [Paracoccidioides lutzii Pb01]EEH37890.2 hypothetical protein PAAG_00811 [Paracoccidioides lutzii Pb01]